MPTISTDAPTPDVVSAGESDGWSATRLIDCIVHRHHAYAQKRLPLICRHLARLADEHGDRHPGLVHLAAAFGVLTAELMTHMGREERILFPWITMLAAADERAADADVPPWGRIDSPIAVMREEHDRVERQVALMRRLADGYKAPADACATWKACYAALEEFTGDLRQHLHLENDLLFPLALRLDRAFRSTEEYARAHTYDGIGPGGCHGRTQ